MIAQPPNNVVSFEQAKFQRQYGVPLEQAMREIEEAAEFLMEVERRQAIELPADCEWPASGDEA